MIQLKSEARVARQETASYKEVVDGMKKLGFKLNINSRPDNEGKNASGWLSFVFRTKSGSVDLDLILENNKTTLTDQVRMSDNVNYAYELYRLVQDVQALQNAADKGQEFLSKYVDKTPMHDSMIVIFKP
jgi:hypothetical protein